MEGGKRKGRGKKNEGEGKEGRWEKKGSLLCAAGNTCTERVQGDGASAADSSVISSSPPTRCAFDATRHVSRERERGVLESRALAATTTTTTRLESNRGPITPTYSSLVGRLASCRDRAIRAFVPFSRFFFLPFLFLLSSDEDRALNRFICRETEADLPKRENGSRKRNRGEGNKSGTSGATTRHPVLGRNEAEIVG